MLGGCTTGCLYFRTVVGNLLGYLLGETRVTRQRFLVQRLELGAEGLRVDSKGFLCIGDVFRIACLLAQSVADKIANDRPEVKAARDAAAKHKAEADALIKYIIRKDKPSTKARAKGLAERIAQLRKDYADIVTEDELKGYEAILEKVKSEADNSEKVKE